MCNHSPFFCLEVRGAQELGDLVSTPLLTASIYSSVYKFACPSSTISSSPSHSLSRDGDHGTIHYVDSTGEPQVVSYYWSGESLQFGDQVEFQVATRSYDKLVMAVDIKVLQKSKDIRFRVRQVLQLCFYNNILYRWIVCFSGCRVMHAVLVSPKTKKSCLLFSGP